MTAPTPSRVPPDKIVIASRESRLALVQSEMIAQRLSALYPALDVSILGMTTRGDQILDRPLAQVGGKGLFIKELEVAIQDGRADLAVHSMKDMPSALPDGFALLTVGDREDPYDALVSTRYRALGELPAGAVVGTSSLRRESQLCIRYPKLEIRSLRGNVETRLRKLDSGEYDAIILAAAGLRRLGLGARIASVLDQDVLPAIGQGALGLECSAARPDVIALLQPLTAAATTATVAAERALGARLLGSCDVPLAAHARVEGGEIFLRAFIAMPDGARAVRGEIRGPLADAAALGAALGDTMLDDGASAILRDLGNAAQGHA